MEHKKYYYKKHKDDGSPVSVIKEAHTTGDKVIEKEHVSRRIQEKKTEDIRNNKEEQ
ncbi:MAG: hypothetical protein QMB63_00215 [Clostridiaceae bacterium]